MLKLIAITKTYLAVFLAIAILSLLTASGVFAQENSMQKASTQSAIVEYDLAFPGILPDNPLYKLKVLRNKISSFLISDPHKRTEFYLLQADKGMLATAMLIDKNKIALANETALKAENNMTLLANEMYRFKQKPEIAFFNKLKTASLKHQEVLSSLIERLPENEKKTLEDVLYFSKSNLRTIEKFQNKKYYN